jgi:hypothetical protein
MFKKNLSNYLLFSDNYLVWDTNFYLNLVYSRYNIASIKKKIIKKRDITNSLHKNKLLKIINAHFIARLKCLYRFKKINLIVLLKIFFIYLKWIIIYLSKKIIILNIILEYYIKFKKND